MAYWCTLVFHQSIQFHWPCIHFVKSSHLLLNSSKLPLTVCSQFVAKCSSLTKRAVVPPHCAHTLNHALYCITWLEISSSVFLVKSTTQLLVLYLRKTMHGSIDTFLGVYIYHLLLMLLPFSDICLWNPEFSYIAVTHSWLISISWTLWCQVFYLCNAQCDTLRRQMSSIYLLFLQPPFKFWSFADYCRHLILAPEG
jgi:hypothetical protein